MSLSSRGLLAVATLAFVAFGLPALGQVPDFDPSALKQYLRRGNEVASGRLDVVLPDGSLVAKRGATVLALPDAPYTRWWLTTSAAEIRDRSGESVADVALPQRLRPFARYAVTDADGNFEVGGLPRGRYLFRGRLSLAFPRSVRVTPTADPYAPYEPDMPPPPAAVVFDYSVVWLDSRAVRVGSGASDDIAFHLVARRDRVDRHHS